MNSGHDRLSGNVRRTTMKKRNIYQNRSQELLSLFKEAGNSAKVMAETGSMKF
jgi:hypothetical protein